MAQCFVWEWKIPHVSALHVRTDQYKRIGRPLTTSTLLKSLHTYQNFNTPGRLLHGSTDMAGYIGGEAFHFIIQEHPEYKRLLG